MRFLPAGPDALLVELDDLGAVHALAAEVARRRTGGWSPALLDVIPGARTLLLDGVDDIPAVVRELRSWTVPPAPADEGPAVEIACRYDGPDLDEVARQWGVAPAEVVALHTDTSHAVAFCGFAPGFAYIAGLDADHAVTRRDNPRAAVPAGSVAVADRYTGIYPSRSPGGWQLIGRTDASLWDAERDPPALLAPGQRVRFVAAT